MRIPFLLRARQAAPGGRSRRKRTLIPALADQAVIAAANAGNGLLATIVLPPARAGVVLVCLATVHVAIGLNRAFIGDVLLASTARLNGDGIDPRRAHTDAIATACCTGAAAAVVLTLAWAVAPGGLLDPLIYLAPFAPALFVHDTARYAYQSRRKQRGALGIDLTWLSVQGGLLGVGAALGVLTGPWLLVAWGLGACVAAVVFLLRDRVVPWRGRPGRWLAHTRRLSVWFTGAAVLGQAQIQLIALLIPGLQGAAAYAGLRLVQLAVLQPVQNVVLASLGLLVPRTAALAETGDAAALRQQIRRASGLALALAVPFVAVVTAAAGPVLDWYRDGDYASAATLAWPVGVQAGVYLLQLPFTATVRGLRRGRLLFAQAAASTAAGLVGVTVGALAFGLVGAAWGLAFGSAIGLAVKVWLTWYALRRLPYRRASAASSA